MRLSGDGVASFEVVEETMRDAFDMSFQVFGVMDHSTGDIIGSGDAPSEALEDAIKTARGWSK